MAEGLYTGGMDGLAWLSEKAAKEKCAPATGL